MKKIISDLIIINMETESDIYEQLLNDQSGLCLSCVGHSDSLCFCQYLVGGEQSTSVTPRFISNNTPLPPQEQETESQNEVQNLPTKPKAQGERKRGKRIGKKPKAEKVSSRKLKKDNISHKKISNRLKNLSQRLLARKLTANETRYYHREDYAIRLFTILEKDGLLCQAYESFSGQMDEFISEFEIFKNEQPEYCDQLIKQTVSFEIAFGFFLKGQHEKSMRIIYDYDSMRQKAKFESAVTQIEEMRRQLGLPFCRE